MQGLSAAAIALKSQTADAVQRQIAWKAHPIGWANALKITPDPVRGRQRGGVVG